MREIKIYPEPIITKSLKELGLDSFFERLFYGFNKELNKVNKVFYNYTQEEVSDIFTVMESTMLGILNNALLREYETDITTLQEFNVWNESEERTGMCDMLINWNKYNLIVEAKWYPFTNDWDDYSDNATYDQIVQKCNEVYYSPEKKYYKGKTRGIIMYFEWIKFSEDLEKAKKAVEDLQKKENQLTNFCALFHDERSGVIMYGYAFELPLKSS